MRYYDQADFDNLVSLLDNYSSTNITNSATNTIFTGKGVLHSIVVNKTVAGAVTIKDSGTTIATLKASIAEGNYPYRVAIQKKLVVTPAATAGDYTVIFKKG